MKTMITMAAAVVLLAAGTAWGGWWHCTSCGKPNEAVVSTETLTTLLNAKTPLVLVDARTGKYDDGKRLPGAVALAPGATNEEIAKVIPDKNALIVAYCVNTKCMASHHLAVRLKEAGYVNVLRYPVGIEGWIAAGHQVVAVKK